MNEVHRIIIHVNPVPNGIHSAGGTISWALDSEVVAPVTGVTEHYSGES